MISIKLSLFKKALRNGGDAYTVECRSFDDRQRRIYIPQSISRASNNPIEEMEIQVLEKNSDKSLLFELTKKAKGSGDNKYTHIMENGSKWDIYLPFNYQYIYINTII